jgi:hypothetical protein
MYICVQCWEENCNCNNKKIELIDDNLIDILKNLNKKGYKTKFSCGGHINRKYVYIYILFCKNYSFPVLPEGYIYKKGLLYYRNSRIKSEKRIQKDIDEKIKTLREWAKKIS